MAWDIEKIEKELRRDGVPKGVMDYLLERPDLGYAKTIKIMDKGISDCHTVNGLVILNELLLRRTVEPDIEKITQYFVDALEIEDAEKVTKAAEQFILYLMHSLMYVRLQKISLRFQEYMGLIEVKAPLAYERNQIRINLAYEMWNERNIIGK